MYSIKQASDLLKVNANAIRFYEKKGLVSPQRSDSGYRQFSDQEMNKLQLILTYRKMGFSLEAIQTLTADHKERNQLTLYAKQYTYLNEHIQAMQKIREVLGESIEGLLSPNIEAAQGTFLTDQMKKTASIIEASNLWKDQWGFDHWATSYDEAILQATEGLDFYKHYEEVISKTADKIGEGSIVEIGIGTGNLAKRIMEKQQNSLPYIGVDQSVNMLRQAKAKCPLITPKIGTFLNLPVTDCFANAIVSSYALHHCNEKEKVLAIAEMDRVLKPAGKIVLTDLMFKDAAARQQYEQSCSPRQLEDLNDEYFGTVKELTISLEVLGYSVYTEQIDELIWIVVGEK